MVDPGIGVGAGGMIASLFNPGLATNVAQHITPNPNPLAQQGQPGDGTVDTLGNPTRPNLAQPAVTQPDPANAANVARLANPPDSSAALDYMRYQRMGQLSDSLNHSIQGIAAGFGTAQQQAAKQAALRGDGTVGGGLGDLAGIQALQDKTIQDNEHARFMANAAVFAQSLSQAIGRPVSIAEATEWMNNKDTMQAATQAMGSGLTPTQTSKDFREARSALTASMKRDNPSMSDADIAAAVDKRMPPDLLLSAVGGNPEDAAYYQYAALERAAGRTPLDPLAWKEQHTVKATEDLTRTKDATEFKDQAIQDVDKVSEKLTTSEGVVDRLLKDIPATMTALKTPDQLTSGQGIAIAKDLPLVGGLVKGFIAPTDATTALAADIRTLKSGLAASALTDVKNVRNRQEFDAIGRSLTAGLDAANSPEAVQRVLEETKRRFAVARINAKAAAGRELSPDEAPLANPDYLKPTLDNGEKNPYFTGATVAKSPAPTSSTPTVSRRRHYNEKGELVDQ